MTDHILLLAGTYEARKLAGRLAEAFPDTRLTVSFAGVVKDLPELGVPVRVGGFGGVVGLTDYLKAKDVSLIIDATHPFAAQMSRNGCAAAETLKLPMIRLERPAWHPASGDLWHDVASMEAAASALPESARAFLAVGRKDIGLFYCRTDCYGLARMIEPPSPGLPDDWELILARPPQSVEDEIALFKAHGITHVVAKNSGGTRSFAKIEAARRLELPVIMVARPVLPPALTADDLEDALRLTKDVLDRKRD